MSVKTSIWERLRAWRSSRSCATTPRTTGSLYRSFFCRMVQRYVKFGNFRSPVAASFAALQKVRSAPPVTGLLLPAVRRLLFAAYSPPASTVRRPLFAVRRLLPVVCRLLPVPTVRPPLPATLCPSSVNLCLSFATLRSPFASRHRCPSPQFAARKQPPRGSTPLRQTCFCPDMR